MCLTDGPLKTKKQKTLLFLCNMLTSQDFHDLLTLNINTVKKKKKREKTFRREVFFCVHSMFLFYCTFCCCMYLGVFAEP